MFKISNVNQIYRTPFSVDIPTGAGKSVTHKFTIVFARKSQDELDELYRRMTPAKLEDGEQQLTDDELLDDVVKGWEDVLDDQDQPLEFTPSNFAVLKNIYPTRPTLVQAFFDSIKTAKRKN